MAIGPPMARNFRIFVIIATCAGFLWLNSKYSQSIGINKNDMKSNTSNANGVNEQAFIRELSGNTSFSNEIHTFLTTHQTQPLDTSGSKICSRYKKEGKIYHIYKTNLTMRNPATLEYNEVTLATQFDAKRFNDFEKLVHHWKGPISVTVYGTNQTFLDFTQKALHSELIYNRRDIFFHIVLQNEEFYPVNFLRNLAKDGVSTKYMYLTDIDLLPCIDCYEKLKNYANKLLAGDKKALVVPAFDFTRYKNFPPYPKSKEELLMLWNNHDVDMFYRIWPVGHRSTKFMKWKTARSPYKIYYEDGFEPYVVMEKEGSPRYEETFLGRIRDKVSYFLHLNALKYTFHTLPDVFTIHQAHRKVLRVPYSKCANDNYNSFKIKLKELYKSHKKVYKY